MAKCIAVEKLSDIPTTNIDNNGKLKLQLWDCFEKDAEKCLIELEANREYIAFQDFLCLFNITPGLGIEENTVIQGVHGFFYEKDPVECFHRGILAICDGELWLSRRIIAKCLMGGKGQDSNQKREQPYLTPREIEILGLVSLFATNEKIAEELCISFHTVKTHIYHIFKKIKAPNRIQSALWATKNLWS